MRRATDCRAVDRKRRRTSRVSRRMQVKTNTSSLADNNKESAAEGSSSVSVSHITVWFGFACGICCTSERRHNAGSQTPLPAHARQTRPLQYFCHSTAVLKSLAINL
eukprot:5720379-Pleurochrysis_carterae.AAC.1